MGRRPRSGPVSVLHLISSADRRGAQVFAEQLVTALGGSPEHRLVAISPATTPAPIEAAALGRSRTDPAGLSRLIAGLGGFDLLVAHGSSALVHGAIASTLARRPFIYRNIGDPAAWGAVTAAQVRIGMPLRRAAAVAALFPDAAAHLERVYRLDPARIATIPNAVPAFDRPTDAERLDARRVHRLDERRRWVGYLGSLSEEKGILDAVRSIAPRSDLGLLVAGAGPQLDEARRLASEWSEGSVVFAGVVEDPRELLAAVDALILPSRTEGLPAAAIEAGLAGIPVVATRVGGVPSIVLDGVTGLLVDDSRPATLSDAVDIALDHRSELGSAARAHCLAGFTIDRVSAQWSSLIDRVVADERSA